MRQLWALVKKEFLQIRRDPRTLGIVLFAPLVMLLLYGFAINFDIHHIGIVVYDQDQSQRSREFIKSFSTSEYFDILGYSNNPDHLTDLLEAGQARTFLWIPHGFGAKLAAGKSSQLFLGVDGSDSNTATISLGYFTAFIRSYSTQIVVQRFHQSGREVLLKAMTPFSIQERIWYNPELVSSHFIVPGLIAVLLMMMVSLLTAMAITGEKERNTFEQLAASPIPPWKLILGKIIPYSLASFGGVLLIIPAGVFGFGVPLRGNLLILMMFIIIFLMAALAMGLTFSTIAKTQQQAMLMTASATLLPAILLSGFVFPIETMPWVLQLISNLVPAKFFLISLRGIFLKGVGLEVLWPQMVSLVIYMLFFAAIAALRFRKRLD
ncbi:MAG: ABC transporter permease [Bacillota bacterium]